MISVIGIGPGNEEQMTMKAINTILASEVVVGYTKYLALIENLIEGKEVIASSMKGEVERCTRAIEEGLKGKKVVVVSSGDSGIYGMAGLIYELAEPYTNLEIEVISGVTAAASAAAVLGAPLMNDFAVISLSDLMTDWSVIEKRLRLAAQADFAIALYNPSSIKRFDYLAKACRLIMEHRSGATCCGFVKNIARTGETHTICTLEELAHMKIDMFTTVIIGNSQTKIIRDKLVTIRGYTVSD